MSYSNVELMNKVRDYVKEMNLIVNEGEVAQLTLFAGWLLSNKKNDYKLQREKANLTIEAVVERTGISKSYIASLETNRIKKPDPDKIERLVKLYNELSSAQ